MRQSDADQCTVIGAGITLQEANKAADALAESGIMIRVIDPFTIKPLDVNTILNSAKQTGGRVVVVEDHYPEGEVLRLIYKIPIKEFEVDIYRTSTKLRELMFSQVCVILSTGAGSAFPKCPRDCPSTGSTKKRVVRIILECFLVIFTTRNEVVVR